MASNILNNIGADDSARVASSGIDLSEKTRSASFMQENGEILFSRSMMDGVEIMSTEEALEKMPGAREYYGKNFAMLGREYPGDTKGGYFIKVKKGVTVALPIQACLFLKARNFRQRVHNIVVVEEGAKVYMITGCAASKAADEGFHLGISEFFIKKGAYLNFTMIHTWKEDINVRPMGISHIEEGAALVSNYVCLKPVREITMYPTAVLDGPGAKASFNSLILSHPGTTQDVGSRVILRSPGTQAEIISRSVSLGGKVIARGHLKAESPDVRAHLECHGLLLSKEGNVQAVPELETAFRDVDMSHEAAIGRISREEIEYLSSRGMPADEAQSVIIRGFMDVNILGLPEMLKEEINRLEDQTLKAGI